MSGTEPACPSIQPHMIIGGFGLPGRYVAELLQSRHIPYCVIDLNPATAARCAQNGLRFVVGDMRDPAILEQAGIHSARLIAITVPDENVALQITQIARQLRPDISILTRCSATSTSLKARQLGATVIVAEQLIAQEFHRLIEHNLSPAPASSPPT